MTGVLVPRGNLDTDVLRGKTIWEDMEKTAIYMLSNKASEETNLANTLISDF